MSHPIADSQSGYTGEYLYVPQEPVLPPSIKSRARRTGTSKGYVLSTTLAAVFAATNFVILPLIYFLTPPDWSANRVFLWQRTKGGAMNHYQLEHVCTYTGTLANPPEIIGPLPEGLRVNFYSTGGEIIGPKIRGKVRPVGGDWVTVRTDGVAYLDVRTTFETHDGALILATYQGAADLGEHGYDNFLRGEMPPVLKLRISPRFATTHPAYLWLNRLFCFGAGEYRSGMNEAKYDVYAVR